MFSLVLPNPKMRVSGACRRRSRGHRRISTSTVVAVTLAAVVTVVVVVVVIGW